jgi:PAS domain-containing protein
MDITEITNIKSNLEESAVKLDAILRSIPDLLLVVDRQ